MKSLLLVLPLLLAGAIATFGSVTNNDPEQPDDSDLKIMAYNIHHCNPPSKPDFIDVEAIARVINAESPDLVALQEVDVHTGRSGKMLHQAAKLAELTDMHYYFKKAIAHDGGEYGIAVLSKLPIADTLGFALPMAPGLDGEQRAVAAIKVKLADGRLLTFASTHLDLKDEHRVLQTEKLVEAFGQSVAPVIIAGDFNAQPGSTPINVMDRVFSRTCIGTDCPGTIPVDNPNRVIDYIFYGPAAGMDVVEHRVIPETYASDHLPIVAVVRVK